MFQSAAPSHPGAALARGRAEPGSVFRSRSAHPAPAGSGPGAVLSPRRGCAASGAAAVRAERGPIQTEGLTGEHSGFIDEVFRPEVKYGRAAGRSRSHVTAEPRDRRRYPAVPLFGSAALQRAVPVGRRAAPQRPHRAVLLPLQGPRSFALAQRLLKHRHGRCADPGAASSPPPTSPSSGPAGPAVPARRRCGPSPRRGKRRSRPASGCSRAALRARSSGGRRAAARGSASTPTSSPRTAAEAADRAGAEGKEAARPREPPAPPPAHPPARIAGHAALGARPSVGSNRRRAYRSDPANGTGRHKAAVAPLRPSANGRPVAPPPAQPRPRRSPAPLSPTAARFFTSPPEISRPAQHVGYLGTFTPGFKTRLRKEHSFVHY